VSERTAPVQGDSGWWIPRHAATHKPPGVIDWTEHMEAWRAYNERHPDQSAERLAERGGFDWSELVMFLGREPTTWRRQ
jgi:hypothetical protein